MNLTLTDQLFTHCLFAEEFLVPSMYQKCSRLHASLPPPPGSALKQGEGRLEKAD